MVKIIVDFFAIALSKKSRVDGRLLLLLFLSLYFLPILFVVAANNKQLWEAWWIYPVVPKMLPAFADMRVITAGYECFRQGYKVVIENPCDPWNRPMNYPAIWLLPSALGINTSHTVLLGALLGLLFFLCFFLWIGRLNYSKAIVYAAILLSPAVMLAVERGNNDLVIFSLLSVALLIMRFQSASRRVLAYGAILFAALLKLYPFFALLTVIREKKRIFIVFFLTALSLFSLYIFSNFEYINLAIKTTQKASFFSYGRKVIFNIAAKSIAPGSSFYPSPTVRNWCSIVSILLVIFLALLAAKKMIARNRQLEIKNQLSLDGFRVSAGIYLSTFALGNNWDYRLIFLIFAIPQILRWIESRGPLAETSTFALIGIVLTSWLSLAIDRYSYADEIVNWLLFFYFTYATILTLPDWLKSVLSLHSKIETK